MLYVSETIIPSHAGSMIMGEFIFKTIQNDAH